MESVKPSVFSVSPLLRAVRAPASSRYLFLLSHMRSYSSLLSHVLGSSPEIDGYFETHVRYRNKLDLWRLRQRIQRSTGKRIDDGWLLDKILHNYIRAPDRLITGARVQTLIFLRRPEPTLRSILTLAATSAEERAKNTPQLVCDYYVSRLHRLRVDGERLGTRALYFDAEAVVDRPAELLALLGNWLDLRQPLSTSYRLFPKSGEVQFGDPSANIRSGRILNSSASTITEDTRIPTLILQEAEAAYQRCRTALMRHCHWSKTGFCIVGRLSTRHFRPSRAEG